MRLTLTDLALERAASPSPEKNNRHPGQAKREPGLFQAQVSVFTIPCLRRTAPRLAIHETSRGPNDSLDPVKPAHDPMTAQKCGPNSKRLVDAGKRGQDVN
jgi:hypothetical protein